ncbi:glycosyltransferase [Lithospermum erythrorhizon]|uniref:Galectin n=1 Tax=Lithospermum erythrorhizon TaxID=34254 RepID=A0AAV3RHF2_LITER
MKRLKGEPSTIRRSKLSYIVLGIGVLYLCFVFLKFEDLFESVTVLGSSESDSSVNRSSGKEDDDGGRLVHTELSLNRTNRVQRTLQDRSSENVLSMLGEGKGREVQKVVGKPVKPRKLEYGRITAAIFKRLNRTKNFTILENMADEAWSLGLKEWGELEKFDVTKIEIDVILEKKPESCPSWIEHTGEQLGKNNQLMSLPCGLAGGSALTVVGTPRLAHQEYVPELAKLKNGNGMVMVSQFMVELLGLKAVSGEDPPRILHLNPRLRGDWSQRSVIEHNTCYRMQWGAAQRCDGVPSKNFEHMLVDGFLRCEKWVRNDIEGSKQSKIISWFQRFIGRANKPVMTWPFPFVEDRLFVLTIRAGVDGYHINVGGRHVTSFPYHTGFTLEDATGLLVKGDVDVHSVYATSLPTSHPSFSPQGVLDFSEMWKANPLPNRRIKMFVGVLSATNHFAERMAVRKTWMQSSEIKSSDVVVRFFVALVSS